MPAVSKSRQLPSTMVNEAFGEINIRETPAGREVDFTVMMEPQGVEAEGWQTGVALDASASMKNWYGRNLSGKVPPNVEAEYEKKGWVQAKTEDGRKVKSYQPDAFKDAIARGFMKFTDNIVEPASREFISYLASNLDADGGTTVIYWACGDGAAFEVVGDFTAEQCATMDVKGPSKVGFGGGTKLTPAVRYFAERFKDAARGMYVFLTDGHLDDLPQVKAYTTQLAKEIEAGQRNEIKCVLVGVGDSVDEGQMEELDDLDTGTSVDIWDHKIHKDMRGLVEIFAEVVSENTTVAPSGRIFDDKDNLVKQFTDGMPAKASFVLPLSSKSFTLEVGDQRITQTVVE